MLGVIRELEISRENQVKKEAIVAAFEKNLMIINSLLQAKN
jgi:hypothetical protein